MWPFNLFDFQINRGYLKEIEEKARNDAKACHDEFMKWVISTQSDIFINEFNASSSQQLQQLFFAPFKRILEIKEKPEEENEEEESENSEEEPKVKI